MHKLYHFGEETFFTRGLGLFFHPSFSAFPRWVLFWHISSISWGMSSKRMLQPETLLKCDNCNKSLQNKMPATTLRRLLWAFNPVQQLKTTPSLLCFHSPHKTTPKAIAAVTCLEKQPLGFLHCFWSKFSPSHLLCSILSPQDVVPPAIMAVRHHPLWQGYGLSTQDLLQTSVEWKMRPSIMCKL